jgi:type IV secretory pathway VirB4 component
LDEPLLLLEEALPLLPSPARQVMPPGDAVWIGSHAHEGRDVFFSFKEGLDPSQPPPPHALSLVLGEMGSGKTSLMRLILLQRLLQGRTAVSLDPEGENNRLCEALGGTVIPAGVPEDPDTCLLHPLQADEPAEMLLAARFLITALSGEAALSPGAQAALHTAVKHRWERRPGPMTLSALIDALGAVGGPEAAVPMALLAPYASGGLWDGFFDRPKALLAPAFPPGAWLNFDLSSLREESKAIVHAVLTWFLYHAVTVGMRPSALKTDQNPDKGGMDIYIDEGWRLLKSGIFADLLDELGRRARKRGVGVILTTHLPGDLARGASSLGLAATAFIGRLGPDEAYSFFRSLGLGEGEAQKGAERVSRLPPRVFLAAPAGGRGTAFPVHVRIPPAWLALWGRLGAAR